MLNTLLELLAMGFRIRHRVILAAVVASLLTGCGDDEGLDSRSAPVEIEEADLAAVAETYAKLVYRSYQASLSSAEALQASIETFIARPSDATLDMAKRAWLTARDDYGPTEAFRFYDGPIDNPDDGPEGQINAWPMDEAYVDYVQDHPTSGIINNPATTPQITAKVLTAANEQGGETNISTGWHAIEFLLWGQDLSATGPGTRPVSDYTTAANAERRKTYLSLLAKQLTADLAQVSAPWAPGGEYRTEFLRHPRQAVQNLLRGIGALSAGELAGERMAVAFETKDQEDEHSCFSDNTNADIHNNAIGIRRVYLAEGVEGMSPSDLVAKFNPKLDTKLRAELDESVSLIAAFPTTFDHMIGAAEGTAEHHAFAAALRAIETQGETIAEAANALGLKISISV